MQKTSSCAEQLHQLSLHTIKATMKLEGQILRVIIIFEVISNC